MDDAGGVLLDWDGTLADTERLWTDAERATVEEFGGEWSPAFKARLIGRGIEETVAIIAEHVGAEVEAHAVIRNYLFHQFEERVRDDLQLKPGAEDLVKRLAAHTIAVALVSNSYKWQVTLGLQATGLRRYLRLVICGDEGYASKPSPQMFARACMGLGIDPAKSIAIDDAQTGVDAARQLQIAPVTVPSPVPTQGAWRHVASLAEFDLDWLAQTARGDHLATVTASDTEAR
jgi:HAD superfamily hydrolase (TIGR01509 family)